MPPNEPPRIGHPSHFPPLNNSAAPHAPPQANVHVPVARAPSHEDVIEDLTKVLGPLFDSTGDLAQALRAMVQAASHEAHNQLDGNGVQKLAFQRAVERAMIAHVNRGGPGANVGEVLRGAAGFIADIADLFAFADAEGVHDRLQDAHTIATLEAENAELRQRLEIFNGGAPEVDHRHSRRDGTSSTSSEAVDPDLYNPMRNPARTRREEQRIQDRAAQNTRDQRSRMGSITGALRRRAGRIPRLTGGARPGY